MTLVNLPWLIKKIPSPSPVFPPGSPLSSGWCEVLPRGALPCVTEGAPRACPPQGALFALRISRSQPCEVSRLLRSHLRNQTSEPLGDNPLTSSRPQTECRTLWFKPTRSPASTMVLKACGLLWFQLLASTVSSRWNLLPSPADLCLFSEVRIHLNSTPLCHHLDHSGQDERLPLFKIQGPAPDF